MTHRDNPMDAPEVREKMREYVRTGTHEFFDSFFKDLFGVEPDDRYLDVIAEGVAEAIVNYGRHRSLAFAESVALNIKELDT